jgi:hypothetical protein
MHFSIQAHYGLQYIYFAEFIGKNILLLDLDGYNVICVFRECGTNQSSIISK